MLMRNKLGRSAMYTQALNTSDGDDRHVEDAERAAGLR